MVQHHGPSPAVHRSLNLIPFNANYEAEATDEPQKVQPDQTVSGREEEVLQPSAQCVEIRMGSKDFSSFAVQMCAIQAAWHAEVVSAGNSYSICKASLASTFLPASWVSLPVTPASCHSPPLLDVKGMCLARWHP